MPPFNRDSTPFSFGVLSHFLTMPSRRLDSFSYWHDSDTMLDEHDFPQLYDIVHFEHKLS